MNAIGGIFNFIAMLLRFAINKWVILLGILIFAIYGIMPILEIFAKDTFDYIMGNIDTFFIYLLFPFALIVAKDIIDEKYKEFLAIAILFTLHASAVNIAKEYQYLYYIVTLGGISILHIISSKFEQFLNFEKRRFWAFVIVFGITAPFVYQDAMVYALGYTLFMFITMTEFGEMRLSKIDVSDMKELNHIDKAKQLAKITRFSSPYILYIFLGIFTIFAIYALSSYFSIIPVTLVLTAMSFVAILTPKLLPKTL